MPNGHRELRAVPRPVRIDSSGDSTHGVAAGEGQPVSSACSAVWRRALGDELAGAVVANLVEVPAPAAKSTNLLRLGRNHGSSLPIETRSAVKGGCG